MYTEAEYNSLYDNPNGLAKPKTKAALAYHGILFAESDEDGVLWFERKDKVCRLFTKAFEKSWERRSHRGVVQGDK